MKKRTKTNEKQVFHPTNSQVQRIAKDIRDLRDNGKSDMEIRETLGLHFALIRNIISVYLKKTRIHGFQSAKGYYRANFLN